MSRVRIPSLAPIFSWQMCPVAKPPLMKSQLVQSSPIGAERAPGNARAISSDLQEMIRRRISTGAAIFALAAVYFCAGLFGLSLAFVNASVSAVWPPTGLGGATLVGIPALAGRVHRRVSGESIHPGLGCHGAWN